MWERSSDLYHSFRKRVTEGELPIKPIGPCYHPRLFPYGNPGPLGQPKIYPNTSEGNKRMWKNLYGYTGRVPAKNGAARREALPATVQEPFPERELPPRFHLEAGRRDPWHLCAGVLFYCDEKTRAECFQRQLLGDESKSILEGLGSNGIVDWKEVRLFLLDTSQNALVGVLKATGPAAENVEPEAWSKQYPFQIKCEPDPLGHELPSLLRGAYRPLEQVRSSAYFDLILSNEGEHQHSVHGKKYARWLSRDQVNALVAMFGRRQVRVAAHVQLGTPHPDMTMHECDMRCVPHLAPRTLVQTGWQ